MGTSGFMVVLLFLYVVPTALLALLQVATVGVTHIPSLRDSFSVALPLSVVVGVSSFCLSQSRKPAGAGRKVCLLHVCGFGGINLFNPFSLLNASVPNLLKFFHIP